MKKEDYSAPQVKVIISPRRGAAGRGGGRYLKDHYMQKKRSSKQRGFAIAVISILVIIALVLSFLFFFPGISHDDDDIDQNLTPVAYIDITNGDQLDADLVTVKINEPVIFSAINSTDEDGTIEEYKWDFGDGSSPGNGIMVHHIYTRPDTYDITLEIVDNKGKTAKATSQVLANAPPVAVIDMIPSPVKVNSVVTVSASGSNDPDWTGSGKGISSYKWDFGDGLPGSSGMNTTHTYTESGNFTVTLTVWDFYNSWDSTTSSISVTLRDFIVSWDIDNDSALSRFGYTRENQTTELSANITQNDLWKVEIKLNWTDFLPLINITDNSDEFQLSVISPSGQNKIVNSSKELIIIEYRDINRYTDYALSAASEVEATQMANIRSPPSDKETGEWRFLITAVDCRGGIILEENQFVGDDGNSWRINVDYYYYTAVITEI